MSFTQAGTMETKGDYFRIDGPSVWIEYNTQGGIIIKTENHPHSVWRDRKGDYDYGKTTSINTISSFEGKFNIFPNPVVDNSTIELSLDQPAIVTISLTDMNGRKLITDLKNNFSNGNHQITLNTNSLTSGSYNCTLEVKTNEGVKVKTKKLTKI